MFLPKEEIKDAFLQFDPRQAITKESPYYVSCDNVRGETGKNIAFKVAEWIEISNGEEGSNYAHCLFTGHVGSGKSSEILNAKEILEQEYRYHVIYLNALETIDINDVYPTDILFSIAQKVYEELELPNELLQNVERWFAEVVYETTQEKEYRAQIEAGLEMDTGIPLLGKLFAKLSGQISKGGSQRELIRRQLKKNMSELLRKVNDMLTAAESKLRNKKKCLVLIIDELEKMASTDLSEEKERADVFFYVHNGHLLTGLRCHLICTVPIFLLNSKSRTILEKNFDKIFELPVIKTKKMDSIKIWEPGIQVLTEIAYKRLQQFPNLGELGLFGGDETLLRQIAEFSGGQVRFFIYLIRNILSACRFEQVFPVTPELLEHVFREEMRAYDMAIFDDRFEHLVNVAKTKKIRREEDNLVDFEMLQQGWVLAYTNYEWWYDVMPVISRLERFQRALQTSEA